MLKETRTLEFKEAFSSTFLKTVSAYSNYEGGIVLFGVKDNGEVIGVDDPKQLCHDIENKINDSITPQPRYSLNVREEGPVVELVVKPGKSKPYLLRGKAYKRNDTSTIEVDRLELGRLILEGSNMTYEELPSPRQDLTFEVLGDAMKSRLGLGVFSSDTLKTLGLLDNKGVYNNAAAVLADTNDLFGVDAAVFGDSINVIRQRHTSDKKSVLTQIDEVMALFDTIYCYEEIQGLYREHKELIPRESFREALTNAVVHRALDIPAHVRVAMFPDRVEITSPGGLPAGISVEEYLCDKVSVRRNRLVADVFLRLGLIEAFGTGILRIKASYEDSLYKPDFEVSANAVKVVLPVLKHMGDLDLSADQLTVYDLLESGHGKSTGDLLGECSLSRSKLGRVMNSLVEMNLVTVEGNGRGTRYLRK